jgi:hypothetical protein
MAALFATNSYLGRKYARFLRFSNPLNTNDLRFTVIIHYP